VTASPDNLEITLSAYLPRTLVERLAAGHTPALGEVEHLEGAALFVDLSGLAPLWDRLTHYGHDGAEALNSQLNAIFGKLIAHVHAYGGGVVSLRGDALAAIFTQPEAAKLAVSCALTMQADAAQLGLRMALGKPFDLPLKFGLGMGSITFNHLGHVPQTGETPWEAWRKAITAGEALDRAKASAQRAVRGDIVADPALASTLGHVLTGQTMDAGFVHLEDVLPIAPDHQPSPPPASLDSVRPYLLAPLLHRLEAGDGHPPAGLRHVTNTFVALHGLDEDADRAGMQLQSYLSQAGDVIRGSGGHLLGIEMGDQSARLHLVFGAPLACEGVAQRALHCALALVALEGPEVAGPQIGIASGLVFAGSLGNQARREYILIGDPVNLSARLSTLAAPGQAVLDARTYRRSLESFAAEAWPDVQMRGHSQPQTVYLLKGIREQKSALETRYLLGKREILGREAGLAAVERVVESTLSGAVGVLIVSGPPGIGKSRLVEEAIRCWLPHGNGFGSGCSPHEAVVPFQLWTGIWKDILLPDVEAEEGDAARLATPLRDRLAALCPAYPEASALLAPFLGIHWQTHSRVEALAPAERRQRLFEVTTALLHSLAREGPLMLVFSDLQWADASSLHLIEHVASHSASLPLLLCLDHRPRQALLPALHALDRATHVELGPLSGPVGWQLIDQMTHDMPRQRWPQPACDELESHLGILHDAVNPLLVEETVNTLIQSGLLVRDDRTYSVQVDHEFSIPNDERDALLARLNTLDDASRHVLQVASVAGGPVTPSLLTKTLAHPMPEAEVVGLLDTLASLDILVAGEREPAPIYHFRHPVMEEAVYEDLPAEWRRDCHARVGQILETNPAPDTTAAVLAHHFDLGEKPGEAIRYSLQAGEQAQEHCDDTLALAHYQTALRHLAALPLAEAWSTTADLRLRRGQIYLEQGRAVEFQVDLEEARQLALYHDDMRRVALAGILEAEFHRRQGDFSQMARVAATTAQLAAEEGCHEELAEALRLQGFALSALGHPEEAQGLLTTARNLARDSDKPT